MRMLTPSRMISRSTTAAMSCFLVLANSGTFFRSYTEPSTRTRTSKPLKRLAAGSNPSKATSPISTSSSKRIAASLFKGADFEEATLLALLLVILWRARPAARRLREFEAVAGRCEGEAALAHRAAELCRDLGLSALLVTRGEKGMTLVARDAAPEPLPAQAREVFDVTGAGDTVIATLATMLACGMTLREALPLANRAGGIVVGKFGTATCTSSPSILPTSARAIGEVDGLDLALESRHPFAIVTEGFGQKLDGHAAAELGRLDGGFLPCRAGSDDQQIVVRHFTSLVTGDVLAGRNRSYES